MNMNRNNKALLLSLVLAAAVLLAGCELLNPISGSGTLVRSVYPAAGFTGIQASNAFVVRVIPDTAYSVAITCDDNLHRYLVVENNAPGVLRLGLVPGSSYFGVTLIAEVHMPVVTVIDASGASTVNVDPGFSSSNTLTVVLSGASLCGFPAITCGDARFDLSGASLVNGAGSAGALVLNVSGASQANLLNLGGTRASVDLSGASQAWVDVGSNPVYLTASGGSTYYYGGTPVLNAPSISGGSRMVRVR
jgi:hypothetical protein